jgi:hypothetical protein
MLALALLQLLDTTPERDHGPVKFAAVQSCNLPQTLFLSLLLGLLPPVQALGVPLLDDSSLG